jgi:hypothetical protein
MTDAAESGGPQIDVRAVAVRPGAEVGSWDIVWAVRNLGTDPVAVRQAWLPHGRFRSPRRDYEPPLRIERGADTHLAFAVACNEEPGAVVENAFVILSVDWRGGAWRILARIRTAIDDRRAPRPVTETISVQPVGFAG